MMPLPVLAGLILMAVGGGLFLVGARLQDRWARGGGLMVVLAGFFVIFTLMMWTLEKASSMVPVALVFGSAAVFQLMTWFEPGPPRS